GWALQQKNDWDGAIREYQSAIRINPKHALARINLGWILRERGQIDNAIIEFEKTIDAAPKWPDGYRQLGWTLGAVRNEFGKAIPLLRKAVAVAPKDKRCYNDLGRVLLNSG